MLVSWSMVCRECLQTASTRLWERDAAGPLNADEIWHHVNVLREQNNLCMHCGITHLIAHKSTVLTKASSWPFTGRVDSTRRSSPSRIPCKWPAALYLEVPGNQDVVRSTKILPPSPPGATTTPNVPTSRTPPGLWIPALARSAGRVQDHHTDWWT